jgi:hypothetical protein
MDASAASLPFSNTAVRHEDNVCAAILLRGPIADDGFAIAGHDPRFGV